MNDPIREVREAMGDKNPFPMTFILEECDTGWRILPKSAEGDEGPPLSGKTPSEAIMVLARSMQRAEALAVIIMSMIDGKIEEDAADQARKN